MGSEACGDTFPFAYGVLNRGTEKQQIQQLRNPSDRDSQVPGGIACTLHGTSEKASLDPPRYSQLKRETDGCFHDGGVARTTRVLLLGLIWSSLPTSTRKGVSDFVIFLPSLRDQPRRFGAVHAAERGELLGNPGGSFPVGAPLRGCWCSHFQTSCRGTRRTRWQGT